MNTLLPSYNLFQRITPVQQAYLLIATGLFLQYSLNALAYFHLLPEIAGKSLSGIVRNSAYLIPGILAVIAVYFFEGKDGCLRLIRPYGKVPLNPFWWIFSAGCLIPVLFFSLYLNDFLYQREFTPYALDLPSWKVIKDSASLIIQVALCDELFWIGFVYPRLLSAGYSPFKASLAMGVFWGLEYFPFLFTEFFVAPGMEPQNLILGWFALTPVYIWLYHKTNSALIVVFFNFCMQFIYNAIPVLPQAVGDNSGLAMANFMTVVLGVFLWGFFPKGKIEDLKSLVKS